MKLNIIEKVIIICLAVIILGLVIFGIIYNYKDSIKSWFVKVKDSLNKKPSEEDNEQETIDEQTDYFEQNNDEITNDEENYSTNNANAENINDKLFGGFKSLFSNKQQFTKVNDFEEVNDFKGQFHKQPDYRQNFIKPINIVLIKKENNMNYDKNKVEEINEITDITDEDIFTKETDINARLTFETYTEREFNPKINRLQLNYFDDNEFSINGFQDSINVFNDSFENEIF